MCEQAFSSSPIPGITIVTDFITEQDETELVNVIDAQLWSGNGVSPNAQVRRRTQQYGHLFSYQKRDIEACLSPLPLWATYLFPRIISAISTPPISLPTHLLINEYNEDQGIMPHTDSPDFFGPVIISLSLLSDCVMTFTQDIDSINKYTDYLLPRRSLLVMEMEGRYEWKHGIAKDRVNRVRGLKGPDGEDLLVEKGRRVSLTFRWITCKAGDACPARDKTVDEKITRI